jgi:prepilin-type processing-associated H-X9-DG protein
MLKNISFGDTSSVAQMEATRGTPCQFTNPSVAPPTGDAEFVPNWPEVYPEYLTDTNILVCPSDADGNVVEEGLWNVGGVTDGPIDPCAITAQSYMYIAWALDPDASYCDSPDPNDPASSIESAFLTTIATVLTSAVSDPDVYDDDVDVTGSTYGDYTIYRLREGIERFFISDINNAAASAMAQSEIAIMFDLLSINAEEYNHVPGGANALYLDGHVEFQKFPGDFPATRVFAEVVSLF